VTALHALAQGAYLWQLEAIEFLLSKGADIEARNKEGMTPLQVAVSTKYGPGFFWCEDAARVLLEHGADPNAVVMVENEDGATSRGLSTLELWGREEVTKMLVKHGARLRDIPAVVARAVQQTMKPETVKLVLEAGMDPNVLPPDVNDDDSSPRYALHEAARPSTLGSPGADYQSRQRAIVDLLLEHGADPWAPYPDGSSVVQCVVEDRGLVGVLMSRIEQDEVERRGRGRRTLLLSACIPKPPVGPPKETWRAHEPTPPVIMADAVHALLDMDADLLATDEEEGRTPLHWLCTYTGKFDEQSKKAFVAVAERSVAALDMVDRLGRKPIHHALAVFTDCSQASAFAVRHLISMGADVGEPDPVTSDSTLHMLARRMVGEKTAAAEASTIFREVAATQDINARNAKGETPVFSFAAAGWKGTHATTWKHRHDALRNDVMHAVALSVFVELGADLMVVDSRGRTLMHATAGREVPDAAHWNQSEDIQDMFARLMELGVDPRAEDETLRTAIDVAVARERREVLALFTEEGRRKAEAERARREARVWDSDSDDFLGFTLTDKVE
jgi:ankyrin repeat protein